MKKHRFRRFAALGTALLISSLNIFPSFAANIRGHLDTVSATEITGWAWDADTPDTPLSIEISITDTATPTAVTTFTVPAQNPREDLKLALGSANHGYLHLIDWSKIPGETFTVTASAISGETKIPLIGSFTYKKEPMPISQPPQPTVSEVPMVQKDTTTSRSPEPAALTAEPGEYLGEFIASGYCNCTKCSGGYSKTYSGTIPQANHTIAADLDHYPIGTKLIIDDIVYTVEDKGNGVNDNRLDIFFASHAEALAFGLQTVDVYAAE